MYSLKGAAHIGLFKTEWIVVRGVVVIVFYLPKKYAQVLYDWNVIETCFCSVIVFKNYILNWPYKN